MKRLLSAVLAGALLFTAAPASYPEPQKVAAGTEVRLHIINEMGTAASRNGDAFSSEESIFSDAQDNPAGLVEGVFDTAPILVFGRRPELSSGRRRRAKVAVPEQASLFGLQ